MDLSKVDIVTIVSAIISTVGLIATFYQVVKTRDSAEAARNSADEVKQKLRAQLGIVDVTQQLHFIEEINLYLTKGDLSLALLRTRDLSSTVARLIQSKDMDEESLRRISESIDDLGRVELSLISRLSGRGTGPNVWTNQKIVKQLTFLRHSLNAIIGKVVYE